MRSWLETARTHTPHRMRIVEWVTGNRRIKTVFFLGCTPQKIMAQLSDDLYLAAFSSLTHLFPAVKMAEIDSQTHLPVAEELCTLLQGMPGSVAQGVGSGRHQCIRVMSLLCVAFRHLLIKVQTLGLATNTRLRIKRSAGVKCYSVSPVSPVQRTTAPVSPVSPTTPTTPSLKRSGMDPENVAPHPLPFALAPIQIPGQSVARTVQQTHTPTFRSLPAAHDYIQLEEVESPALLQHICGECGDAFDCRAHEFRRRLPVQLRHGPRIGPCFCFSRVGGRIRFTCTPCWTREFVFEIEMQDVAESRRQFGMREFK